MSALNAFVPLPRAWTEKRSKLTHSAQLVYIDLLLAMRPSTGVVTASVRQIAASTHFGLATVSAALTELETAGVIERTTTGKNQNRTSEYIVRFRRGVSDTEHPPFGDGNSDRTAEYSQPNTDRTARGISPAETPPLDLSLDGTRPLREYEEAGF